jgi:predicted nucleic acid-binding protein
MPGPLIGIARTGHLFLLKNLYNSISIPSRVFEELKVSSHKPGTMALSEAINAGWIKIVELNKSSDSSILRLLIDAGEAEAIQLALEITGSCILIKAYELEEILCLSCFTRISPYCLCNSRVQSWGLYRVYG